MFAAHVACVQTAVDSELAFLADYQEPVEGWGRERVATLPTAATEQAALPVRMGGMGIKVMGLADARIAAMVAGVAAAVRLREGATECGGLAGKDSKGYSWVADMADEVLSFGGSQAEPLDYLNVDSQPRDASPPNAAAAAATAADATPAEDLPAPVLYNSPRPTIAEAISGAAGAHTVLGACNEGFVQTLAIGAARDALSTRNTEIFDELTTRVIFNPYGEPSVIKCSIPESPKDVIVSCESNTMQHAIHQAAEALQHIHLIDITHCSAECSQRISALRLKFSNIIFDVIPSSHQFVLSSVAFSFAIRHRLGLNVGFGHDFNRTITDLFAKSKICDLLLHNAIRDTLVIAASLGGADFVCPEPNQLWIDPATRAAVVPDLAGRREGKTYGIDVHAHSATSTSTHSLTDRIAYADTIKRNGKGTVEAYHRARTACEAADAAARADNCPQLVARARAMRRACNQAHHGGYEIAAAAAGDTFLPAGFSEYAGYADSARKTLKHIMHPGDSLARDEAGERFDGGVAASWATRSHRMFTAHSVAVSATRAVYRAASRETRRTKTPSSPPSAKYPHKYSAHSARSATLRNARMSNRVA